MENMEAHGGWRLSIPARRAEAERFEQERPELAALDPPPAIVALEDDSVPGGWRVDVYFEERPDEDSLSLFERLVGRAGTLAELPPADWVTVSQAGLEPIRAGRFHVRAARHPADPDSIDLVVEASRAFGTGHHDTTRACLGALDRLKRQGFVPRRIADIGTGTGLLAFAAHRLWPAARIVASDIDPVAVALAAGFAAVNGLPVGRGRGRLELVAAPGTRHRRIAAAAPYDLLVANILAGPLVALAPDFADAVAPGGTLLVAGLVEGQRATVVRACARAGFRLEEAGDGEWPALRFARRRHAGYRRRGRTPSRLRQPKGDTGEW